MPAIMILNVLSAYREKSVLCRKEYLVGLLLLLVIYISLYYVYNYIWSSLGELTVGYLIVQSVMELLFWIALTPLSIARLRDMCWSSYFVLAYFPLWLLGRRNLVIFDLIWNSGQGLSGIWLLWLPQVLLFIGLGMLFLLLIVPKKRKGDTY